MLLEASLQVFLIIILICRMEALLWRLVILGESVSVYNKHVLNIVFISLSEVADQQISRMLRHIFFHMRIVDK